MIDLMDQKDLNDKSYYYLREFLKPIKKTQDNLAIRLSILFLLKHIAPKRFKELELNQYIDGVISEIKEILEKSEPLTKRFTSTVKRMVKIKRSLYELQAKLDFWYYTKLLGFKDDYKVNGKIVKKNITDNKITNIDNPKDAVLFYIYIRTLTTCDPEKYGRFKKYISHLRHVAQKDGNLYAYFLTHVILYDTYFGQKEAPTSSLEALKELHHFCENNLIFERENVDLMSEIIICCKLCQAYDFPFYRKLVNNVISTDAFLHYHENAVLAVATVQWEQNYFRSNQS